MDFTDEELEIINAIRTIHGCKNMDEYECLEIWNEIEDTLEQI